MRNGNGTCFTMHPRQLSAVALQKRVAHIRCPTHGETPTVDRDTADPPYIDDGLGCG